MNPNGSSATMSGKKSSSRIYQIGCAHEEDHDTLHVLNEIVRSPCIHGSL
jgi:hypothetical protein